ncbi:MAG TPA: TPM domain-containing protein [Rudaea sp.]|nr:TPM domain-containing protein [Rudaea sp.]
MRVARTFAAVLAIAALTLGVAWAANDGLQPIPPFGARVTDLTNTLSAGQVQSLTQQLQALEQRKGSRVAILILATTQPEDIAQYSIRVTDAWKLSRTDKQAQDGVLLIVAKDDHRVRIEVGRDLEGAIPDAAADRIIREYITPKFRAGDFNGGITDALGALTKLIDGEALPPPLTDNRHGHSSGDTFNLLFPFIFAVLWLRAFLGRLPSAPRAGLIGAICGGAVWLFTGVAALAIGAGVIGLLFGWLGGSGGGFAGGGGFGGWSGGGWSSGSSGGGFSGGFSGGSSGGFSGGGASGSW